MLMPRWRGALPSPRAAHPPMSRRVAVAHARGHGARRAGPQLARGGCLCVTPKLTSPCLAPRSKQMTDWVASLDPKLHMYVFLPRGS